MAAKNGDKSPLLAEEGNIRKRNMPNWPKSKGKDDKAVFPIDWNPDLPYGGRVYLARRKKPDPWWVIAIEVRNPSSIINCFQIRFNSSGRQRISR
jgi:hypothetical protein